MDFNFLRKATFYACLWSIAGFTNNLELFGKIFGNFINRPNFLLTHLQGRSNRLMVEVAIKMHSLK